MSEVIYEKLIFQNDEKAFQVRLVINIFKETEYLHLRKYFLDFEGEWLPSSEGIGIPLTFQNIFSLLDGLVEVCAKAESDDTINKYFKDKLDEQNRTVSEPVC